jgi:hypothetical protein
MPIERSRRHFLSQLGVAGVAGMAGLAGARFGQLASSFAAELLPEVTTITIEKAPSTCLSPQYVAEDLLQAIGCYELMAPDHVRNIAALKGRTAGHCSPHRLAFSQLGKA